MDIANLSSEGLSPRVRGNRTDIEIIRKGKGSIPARAGEPSCDAFQPRGSGVYPRACGGTCRKSRAHRASAGLSPRVRGNPLPCALHVRAHGSIPARAGEPSALRSACSRSRVYPRACGGTGVTIGAINQAIGLSPRVRGNPHSCSCSGPSNGSIPARAGEPASGCRRPCRRGVYPRACGGTPRPRSRRRSGSGLSPRVRGNHLLPASQHRQARSIPARAGEPGMESYRQWWAEGLSPRVRGNPAPTSPMPHPDGSYPRACGGTAVIRRTSPLPHPDGSIPARAGEPPRCAQRPAA